MRSASAPKFATFALLALNCLAVPAPVLLALHGYTMNARFGASVARMLAPLGESIQVLAPDAPLVCSDEAVARFYSGTGLTQPPGPYCTWWRANEDNSLYEGWEQTRALVERAFTEHSPVGLLGFSQGAMVASACAALSARGELPRLGFVILVAGRVPRANAFRTLFSAPIEVPSMHVWGERDAFSKDAAPALLEHFAPATREKFVAMGGHVFPTAGPAAAAMCRFVESRLGATEAAP